MRSFFSRYFLIQCLSLLLLAVGALPGAPSLPSVHAQGGNLVWSGTMGGNSTDMSHGVAVDASGNIYTIGGFQGTVDFDPGETTFNLTATVLSDFDPYIFDVFVSKLDSDGNFLWAKAVRGTDNKNAWGIALDLLGNIYISGYFQGTVDFDPGPADSLRTSKGENDIFAMKLDSNGNFLWVKTMGMTGDDRGQGIAVDSSANVYLSGIFANSVDFDPGDEEYTLTSAGGTDPFICKLDSNGNFLWAGAMEGPANGAARVAVDTSGNVYLYGMLEGTTDFDPGAETFYLTSNGAWDIFVSKLQSNGQFSWAKAIGGEQWDMANDFVIDPFGNIYATGSFQGTVDFDPGPDSFPLTSTGPAGEDIFILKLDNSGNLVWARAMGGPGRIETGVDIAVDLSGNVYSTGYFSDTADFDPGPETVNLSSAGDYDLFISKLDRDGDYIWAESMGGVGEDIGTGIAMNNSAAVYLTGFFEETVDVAPGDATYNLTSNGGSDIFVSKLAWKTVFPWPLFLPVLKKTQQP